MRISSESQIVLNVAESGPDNTFTGALTRRDTKGSYYGDSNAVSSLHFSLLSVQAMFLCLLFFLSPSRYSFSLFTGSTLFLAWGKLILCLHYYPELAGISTAVPWPTLEYELPFRSDAAFTFFSHDLL